MKPFAPVADWGFGRSLRRTSPLWDSAMQAIALPLALDAAAARVIPFVKPTPHSKRSRARSPNDHAK